MSTMMTSAARQVWKIDAAHTTVEFAAKHMVIATVKGRFGRVEGAITMGDEGGGDWAAEVRIDAASIETHVEQRDAHLRSPDFLDVDEHPEITFRSTRLEGRFGEPGDRFRVVGELTIRGRTREVRLDAAYHGTVRDPWGDERLMFAATTRIDRREFGLTWNQALETGGVLVSNEVAIHLDVQVVKEG